MARTISSTAPKQQTSPGYFWILLLTASAAVGGILLLVMEMSEYDWQSEPKVTPAPKVVPLEPAQRNAAPAPAPKEPGG